MHRFTAGIAIAASFLALCLTTVHVAADSPTKEPTAAQRRIARAISEGHAYEKHVVMEKLFPDVESRHDFMELIARVLANPTHQRKLENDREAYYERRSNTLVLYNPHARDKGTCFRPNAGLRYFENLK